MLVNHIRIRATTPMIDAGKPTTATEFSMTASPILLREHLTVFHPKGANRGIHPPVRIGMVPSNDATLTIAAPNTRYRETALTMALGENQLSPRNCNAPSKRRLPGPAATFPKRLQSDECDNTTRHRPQTAENALPCIRTVSWGLRTTGRARDVQEAVLVAAARNQYPSRRL